MKSMIIAFLLVSGCASRTPGVTTTPPEEPRAEVFDLLGLLALAPDDLEAVAIKLEDEVGVEVRIHQALRATYASGPRFYLIYSYNRFEAEQFRMEATGEWAEQTERARREEEECFAAEREMLERQYAEMEEACGPLTDPDELHECEDSYNLQGDLGTDCYQNPLPDLPLPEHCSTDVAVLAALGGPGLSASPDDSEVGTIELLHSVELGQELCELDVSLLPYDFDGDDQVEWLVEYQSEIGFEDYPDNWVVLSVSVNLHLYTDELEAQLAIRTFFEEYETTDLLESEGPRYWFEDLDGDGSPDLVVDHVEFNDACADLGQPPRIVLAPIDTSAITALSPGERAVELALREAVLYSRPHEPQDESCAITSESERREFRYVSAEDRWQAVPE